jgi:hypothetical protein
MPLTTTKWKPLPIASTAVSVSRTCLKMGAAGSPLYLQELEAGYAAPGLATARDQTQYGGAAMLPLTDRLAARLKMDRQVEDQGLETEAGELNLDYQLGEHWTLSSGVRRDSREDNSPVVPETQEEGDRRMRWSSCCTIHGRAGRHMALCRKRSRQAATVRITTGSASAAVTV